MLLAVYYSWRPEAQLHVDVAAAAAAAPSQSKQQQHNTRQLEPFHSSYDSYSTREAAYFERRLIICMLALQADAAPAPEEKAATLGPKVAEGENVFGVAHIFASFNDTFVVSIAS